MTPPEPANDERPPLWPGLSKRADERFWLWFSLAVIACGIAFMLAVLDARHWVSFGITIGIASFFIIGAALWRLVVYGRA
ncbi:hypothetical protein [Methylobacterium sp. J-067]|uniref:hypothetical protein n=1 Tax=Methylobacterium sp. J-067 TaxID=2836648 RepID=UPI001FB9E23A|nr:hypothetical protein [Methylobacterium sp. J-067]MCJ2023106.1 hypothetical protein [Methylobacterium sp. J-067]